MSYLLEYMGYNPYDNVGPDEYYTFCDEKGLKPYSNDAHYAWVEHCRSDEYLDTDYIPVHGPVQLIRKQNKQKETQRKEDEDLPF